MKCFFEEIGPLNTLNPNWIADWLVSFSQRYVLVIMHGQAGCPVEFCAKISASVVDGAALWIGSVGTLTPIENNYSQKGGLEKGLEVTRL